MNQGGELFDKNYHLINSHVCKEKLKKTQQLKFPRIKDFETFTQFEQAAIQWTKSVKELQKGIETPIPIGTHYFRPHFISSQEEEQDFEHLSLSAYDEKKSSRSSSGAFDHLVSPRDRNSIGEISKFNFKEIDNDISSKIEDELLPDFLEDTISILGENEIWSNSLIPIEPDPYNYDSFTDYENALNGWSKIVMKSLSRIPPHASDFKNLHGLHDIESKNENMVNKKIKNQNENQNNNNNNYYDYNKNKNKNNNNNDDDDDKNKNKNNNSGNNNNNNNQGIRKQKNDIFYSNVYSDFQSWILKQYLISNDFLPKTGLIAIESLIYQFKNPSNKNLNYRYFICSSLKNRYLFEGTHTLVYQNNNDNNNMKEFMRLTKNLKLIVPTVTNEVNNQQELSLYERLLIFFEYVKGSIHESITLKPFRVMGKLHGTFTIKDNHNTSKNDEEKKNLEDNEIIKINNGIDNLGYYYLRRNDVLTRLMQKSEDCERKIENIDVIFNIPKYDVDFPIDLNQLQNLNTNELNQTRKLFEKNTQIEKHNYLYSWYYPKTVTSELITNQLNLASKLIAKNKHKLKIQELISILNIQMNLDTFKKFLMISIYYESIETIHLDIIHSLINKDTIKKLLDLYHHSCSKLIHSKISYLIIEFMKTSNGISTLNHLSIQKETKYLYLLSYSIHWFSNDQSLISPLIPEEYSWSNLLFTKDYKNIESAIFKMYYLTKILTFMKIKKNESKYKKISPRVEEMLSNIQTLLIRDININHEYYEKNIWLGINNRSTTISGYYLFILTQLIKQKNDKFHKLFISSENFNLTKMIFNLSFSKFRHVRICSQIIIDIIIQDSEYVIHLINSIFDMKNGLLEKIFPTANTDNIYSTKYKIQYKKYFHLNYYNNNNNISSLIFYKIFKCKFERLNNLIDEHLLDKEKKTKVNQNKLKKEELKENLLIINSGYFEILVDHLYDLIFAKERSNLFLKLISKIISKMSKIILKIGQIKICSDNPNKDKNVNHDETLIDQNVLIPKLFYIKTSTLEKIFKIISIEEPISNKLKFYLMGTLINFSIEPTIYDYYISQDKFFSYIYTCIRCTENYRLATLTWNFIYNIILYNPNSKKQLFDEKKLQYYFGLISSGATITIITSGLNFLNRMLTFNENLKCAHLIQKQLKSNESLNKLKVRINDIHQKFLDFFNKHLVFVKLNMLYMKFFKEDSNKQNSDFVFSKLAKSYFLILSKPYCQKILKINRKKEPYKDGFKFFELILFGKNREFGNSTTVLISQQNQPLLLLDTQQQNSPLNCSNKKKKFSNWFKKK
ncbi:hypothetical protein M0813_13703 [Anaeramoeba flamelloides]|uniref:Uncharacterized protein n=1 Tax=Anaeramoeba flamelloides TaxID=1746091 RepID=A0ABQ8Z7I0_9EUKA|nr:hypothetical protein M0813_13703 [Anaeramoeba flamelloides]